jgi:hypothetical protein
LIGATLRAHDRALDAGGVATDALKSQALLRKVRENPSKQATDRPTNRPKKERKIKRTEPMFIESNFEEFPFVLLKETFLKSNPLNFP